ncbi:cytochrome c, class I [Salinisphaera sp. PC39]|uniref:c-type cytochrome n=1 Tax=Salinisphaera sp. PC39 TaxID=1304156 RepID=UPI00333FC70A
MPILRLTTTLFLTAVLGAGAAQAADSGRGHGGDAAEAKPDRAWLEQKLKTCASCHGPNGAQPIAPNYPIIAGQHKSYLVYSLEGYRDGKRNNAIMAGQAQGLSDAQIQALADYFSRQESPLHTPSLQR